MKKFDRYDILDVASTAIGGLTLYFIHAPWWAYLVLLLGYGIAQRIIGRAHRGKELGSAAFNS